MYCIFDFSVGFDGIGAKFFMSLSYAILTSLSLQYNTNPQPTIIFLVIITTLLAIHLMTKDKYYMNDPGQI
jgi:hypothetical protein